MSVLKTSGSGPAAKPASEGSAAPAPPKVWLLLDDRPGHTTQAIGLAEALGWPYQAKRLRFTALNRLSNRLLGASLLSLDRAGSDPLEVPWPDLVIAMGRRTAPIARWVKRRSGGRTRLVQLGRKAANVAGDFDLAIACRHFQQPAHPRRIDLLLPPTQVTPPRLQEAAARWPELFGAAARPRVALLVGGTTAHHRLSAETAARMAAEVAAFAAASGGSLTCVTSRRSGPAVEAALQQGAPDAAFHFWRRERADNPYLGYLALADILVVTGESESMLAEAADAGKPLFIYPVPAKPAGLRARIAGRILAAARGAGVLSRLCEGLIQKGFVVPPRDLSVMHRGMAEAGVAQLFRGGQSCAAQSATGPAQPGRVDPAPLARFDAVTARIRALLEFS